MSVLIMLTKYFLRLHTGLLVRRNPWQSRIEALRNQLSGMGYGNEQ